MANRLSLSNTSSTGTAGGVIYFDPPVRTLTMHTWTVAGTTGAGTTILEGSVNGSDWTTIATSTNSGTNTLLTSTSAHLVSAARAVVGAHSAGGPINASVIGA